MNSPATLLHEGELEARIPRKPLPQRCYVHVYRAATGGLIVILSDLTHRAEGCDEPTHYGLSITNGITAFVNVAMGLWWQPGDPELVFFEHISRVRSFGAADARGEHSLDRVVPEARDVIAGTYAHCRFEASDQAAVEALLGQPLTWLDTLR